MEKLSLSEKVKLSCWMSILQFVQKSNIQSNEFLKQYDLNVSKFDMLHRIQENQPITQKELGEKLLLSKGGVSQMIKQFEADGWITRQQEWKEKYISLTDIGQEQLDTCFLKQSKQQASVFDNLTKQEVLQLAKISKKLMN
ncbi:MarR family winged helix-turn-helix transcriptional regulator [Candidatus Enterococcus ikei]|uniref:MarR family transcriptional regulator n=1 Tax=Candidatus Enterococcus ikei TaxID=2815326 RepID=A0ABS3GYJ3_9ENTE|nr:MarR family transcriptional regulator [Enterococcus sp. DIV0869a]MBO0440317.1 MarR family transcriptional regulator [Enterococcus sp. DIV0869a]